MEMAVQPEVPGIGGIRLRPWRDDDREAVLQAYRDPDIIRWITQVPEPDDSFVRTWLRNRQESRANGSLIGWAVTADGTASAADPSAATTEVLLGSVGLKRFDYARRKPPPVHADVTYWIVPAFRGHGLATIVASFAARWAWSAHRLHRVELHPRGRQYRIVPGRREGRVRAGGNPPPVVLDARRLDRRAPPRVHRARELTARPQASPAQTTQAGTSLSPSGTAQAGETRMASSG
jgi:RimJ/RimL family protein N-acetyltransferase